ncbi:hypothetical protein JYU34_002570 [Plutella xylostella]|uniref:SOCS box domain-containing protein n=1 Tax=Plutella xylostella TaxID=51655 RepID=A0ABQ7R2K5_PLUXY|nr:hypothetical protein JYU34_002570 [Plutella xylostella]
MDSDNALENSMYQAISDQAYDEVNQLLLQGADPNKATVHGKTCLGQAAYTGNIRILKLLIDLSTEGIPVIKKSSKKRHGKSQKRKLRNDGKNSETAVKLKNFGDRKDKEGLSLDDNSVSREELATSDKNQGYFVFIHSEGSSSDDSRVPALKSPLSPATPTPQGDLEWDEDINTGSIAPTTREDETWSSMYMWYAAILENTGSALASASLIPGGINQQDAFMRTALHYAADQGHTEAAKLLIDAGCRLDVQGGDGFTPLHIAAFRNHKEITKLLVEAGAFVNYKSYDRMTPIHFAAKRGYLDVVKLLAANRAYLEARDGSEWTPLYQAARRGHADVVRCLIDAGANVNSEDAEGSTPLCVAVWQGHTAVVETLLAAGARIIHSQNLLYNAILQNHDEIVKMLSVGGGINLHNDNGDTPLLFAARLGQPDTARILLEKGANVNSRNSITGANALHTAVEHVSDSAEFEDLLVTFVQHDIDINSTALTGDTALNRALLIQKDHAARLLIQYGADVNACDLLACGLDNLTIVRRRSPALADMLLKAGHAAPPPDPHAPPPRPGSAAHWLYHACRQPLALADICRIKIRNMTDRKQLFDYITLLPLPKSLHRFLMMKDEGLN